MVKLFWLGHWKGSRGKLSVISLNIRSRGFAWVTEENQENTSRGHPARESNLGFLKYEAGCCLLNLRLSVVLLEMSVKRIISLSFWEKDFLSHIWLFHTEIEWHWNVRINFVEDRTPFSLFMLYKPFCNWNNGEHFHCSKICNRQRWENS
jgi:hypothetical protein